MSDTEKIHLDHPYGDDELVNRDHNGKAAERLERQLARQKSNRTHRAVTVPRETSPLRTTGNPSDASEADENEADTSVADLLGSKNGG